MRHGFWFRYRFEMFDLHDVATIVLQTCGVFSSSCIKHNNTSECYRGIISTRGCPIEVKSNVKCLGKNMFFFLKKPCWNLIKCRKHLNVFDFFYHLYFTVLGLQMASFAIIGLTTTSTIWFICCKHDDDEDNPEGCLIFSGFMVCLYPVAGIVIRRMIISFNKTRFH